MPLIKVSDGGSRLGSRGSLHASREGLIQAGKADLLGFKRSSRSYRWAMPALALLSFLVIPRLQVFPSWQTSTSTTEVSIHAVALQTPSGGSRLSPLFSLRGPGSISAATVPSRRSHLKRALSFGMVWLLQVFLNHAQQDGNHDFEAMGRAGLPGLELPGIGGPSHTVSHGHKMDQTWQHKAQVREAKSDVEERRVMAIIHPL